MSSQSERLAQLEAAIRAQESLRPVLGDAVVDAGIAALRAQADALRARPPGGGAELLERVVPPKLAERMRQSSARAEGERKPVTVLFADVVNSTELAERLDPEEVKLVMDEVLTGMIEAVVRYEGYVAQLLGDGLLAFFGAPLIHEDDPERAARAALDIQEHARAIAEDLRRSWAIERFQVRAGLNTGEVVLGALGSDLHAEYLAIGGTVNIAARLQAVAAPGGIVLTEPTRRRVEARFECRLLGPVSVKGVEQPVPVYTLVGPRAVPGRARGIEGLSSPLVGRAPECAALGTALGGLREGRGQIVAVIGEAGVGKTRLVEEARAAADPALAWLEGRGLSYGQMLPFWTIGSLLKADLGVSESAPEGRLRVGLRRRVTTLFGEPSDEVFPYLAHLLGIRLEGEAAERVRALESETLKRQTIRSLAQYFHAVARERPTVLWCEDLHWADPSTLDVLEALMPLTDRVPLMLLLVFRPEHRHGAWRMKWKAETDFAHRYTEIALGPLSPEQADELANNLLAVSVLPEALRRLILDRAEGNPFYLEELIRSLIEQGALAREGSGWRASADVVRVSVPDSLQGVLLGRIDRLADDVRHTLQLASVIGRNFLFRVLDAVSEAEQQLDEHMAQLQRADLVRERTRRPELEYMFKHPLTQEATYNSLLAERRREFHRRTAEALERLFADRVEEFYGVLAHHFDRAGDGPRAVEYLLRAGDQARLQDAHEEAVASYRRALEILAVLGDAERAARTWLKLGLVHHANFDAARAHDAYERAFALQSRSPRAAAAADPAHLVRIGGRVALSLDPGYTTNVREATAISHLFAGIAEVDEELNLVPDLARSWELTDDGCRYVIHLRQDACWTDGAPVTARDYEWAWKRNLRAGPQGYPARMLDEVVGARAYREHACDDPGTVGVRALDDWTLEVRLIAPIAYFPYLFAFPVTYPLPRAAVERYGDAWWRPEHIVSNGAFRLAQFEPGRHLRIERNPGYPGTARGNLFAVEWLEAPSDRAERARLFREGHVHVMSASTSDEPASLGPCRAEPIVTLHTTYLVLAPARKPLDDARVRRALVHALDRAAFPAYADNIPATGGMIPPGVPAHSPDLGLCHDPERARALLAEAGYPGGAGFPALRAVAFVNSLLEPLQDLARRWRDVLGIEVASEAKPIDLALFPGDMPDLFLAPWVADYPDPDSFMRQIGARAALHAAGWRHEPFEALVEQAARTRERARRMAIYREADALWVAEQAVVAPLTYGGRSGRLITQPWIEGCSLTRLGWLRLKDAVIVPH